MIRFRLLGDLQLQSPDGTELRSVLAQPKRLAVLTYLALSPRGATVRRDTLLSLFWPELDDPRGRSALSQALYYLRRSLGPAVLTGSGEEDLGVDPERLWCDAAVFRESVAEGRHQEALERYGGELMPGFHLSDAPDWERWLESERAALRELAARSAWTLAQSASSAGDAATAVHRGRQAVGLGPDESRLRECMTRLADAGERAGALQLYAAAEERLSRDLDLEPSAETTALARRIREARGGRAEEVRAPGATPAVDAALKPAPGGMAPGRRRRLSGLSIGWATIAVLTGLAALTFAADRLGSSNEGPSGGSESAGAEEPDRIAVLPLADASGPEADSYLGEAVAEELITRFSRLETVRVIAATSAMQYRDPGGPASDIGSELGVGRLVRGSIRKSGDSLVLAMRLEDVESGAVEWAASFAGPIEDLPGLIEEIAADVADAMGLAGTAPGDRVARADSPSPDAYMEYLRGRYYLGRLDARAFIEARDRFVRALDLDPTFAPAYSGLSQAYNDLSRFAVLPAAEASPRARQAAEQALELDPGLAEAHATLGVVQSMYYWDSEAAERHFRRALDLDPSSARAHREYAAHLRDLGRFEEALTQIHEAQALDPLLAFSRIEEGLILYMARRYEEAIAEYEQFLLAVPNSPHTYTFIALAMIQLEKFDAALEALERADPEGRHPDAIAIRGYAHARAGREEAARRMLARLDRVASARPVNPFHRAAIHVGLGEHYRALDLLEQAAEQPTWHMRLLKVEPTFDPLRSEQRFRALLARVGLAD